MVWTPISLPFASRLTVIFRCDPYRFLKNPVCFLNEKCPTIGVPQSSIFTGFSLINHPFGVPPFVESPKSPFNRHVIHDIPTLFLVNVYDWWLMDEFPYYIQTISPAKIAGAVSIALADLFPRRARPPWCGVSAKWRPKLFWRFPTMGVPQNGWFRGNILSKWMIWGGIPILGNHLIMRLTAGWCPQL